jgi:1,4-dihydroxy-6-naphthoate synthase
LETLYIGHSPDADDAFMFYALAEEKVKIGDYHIDHVMEDIESLNRRAKTGELPVTAISTAVYPEVADTYRIMSCGSSVGRNYGPIVLARESQGASDLPGKRIAVPGPFTTAFLLLRLYVPGDFEAVQMDFDRVMDAIANGDVDAGVIIHEGQLTWKESGLHNVLDLGKAWMEDTGLPIPLGLDVIHRDLGDEKMRTIARALKKSIVYARDNEEAAIDYAIQFGRGVDRDTCRNFVRMYVNEDTVDMGDEGRRALETLFGRAVEKGLLDRIPPLDIIHV